MKCARILHIRCVYIAFHPYLQRQIEQCEAFRFALCLYILAWPNCLERTRESTARRGLAELSLIRFVHCETFFIMVSVIVDVKTQMTPMI